jgi:hypothetical protein
VRPLAPLDAQKLIVEPLSALGFVFENKGLILRILSQANYHPGLIQIFCYRLLENLYSKWARNSTADIRRIVTLEDLQNVERNREFIEDIRNRFDWTLDLDDRYKVLTYSLVLTQDPTMPRSEHEFIALARDWWPEVFDEMDQQAFRAVLDEMEGLGVLVREDEEQTRKYRIRSPNLLRLLGTRREIEDELQRIIVRDAPTVLNPRNFHPLLEKGKSFGPLTKEQDGLIANASENNWGIFGVVGSNALGLGGASAQIQEVFAKQDDWRKLVLSPQQCAVPEKVVELVRDKMKPRSRKHLYVFIDLSAFPKGDGLGWFVDELAKVLKKCCTKKNRGQVFLMVPPLQYWEWLNDLVMADLFSKGVLHMFVLRRWSDGAITNALENAKVFDRVTALGEEIFAKTTGWHVLIHSGLEKLLDLSRTNLCMEEIVKIFDEQYIQFQEMIKEPEKNSVLLRDFALSTGNCELDLAVEKLFAFGQTDKQLLISFDTVECIKEDIATLENLLAGREELFLVWLQELGLIHKVSKEQWKINRVAAELHENIV